MNKNIFKIKFSKKHSDYVVVSELSTNNHSGVTDKGLLPAKLSFKSKSPIAVCIGMLLSFAAWGEPSLTALPVDGKVVYGQANISQAGSTMTIQQLSNKASTNWQSFDIGASAHVNIEQPSNNSVLLNRVLGNSPSEVFGSLNANGHVILINPNGVLFGKDGSVNARSFTASTFSLSDEDFIYGRYRFQRNGSNGYIINNGKINAADGGYVALIGVVLNNNGQIVAPHGTVGMVTGDTVSIPMSSSGKITFDLSPASINTSVVNSSGSLIKADDGQVYIKASSLNSALTNVMQSGEIDVSGDSGGQVQLLSDAGNIKVNGVVNADGRVGNHGSIVLGRDVSSGALAANTDVSGATLSSKGGFIETSGDWLKTDGVNVKAVQWLLDPADITIGSGTDNNYGVTNGNFSPNGGVASSTINVATINSALNNDTNVSITTTNNGSVGSANGNIYVNSAIQKTAGSEATLRLNADNTLQINAAIESTSGKLNVIGIGNGAVSGSQGVVVSSGNAIKANGGDVTLSGSSVNNYGVSVAQTSSLSGGNVEINGTAGGSGVGILIERGVSVSADKSILLNGTSTGSSGNAVLLGSNPNTDAINLTSGTTTTISGTSTNSANSSDVLSLSDFKSSAGSNINITATTPNSSSTAIRIYKNLSGGNSIASVSGDVVVSSNQGGVSIDGPSGSNIISGQNVYIYNTGGTVSSGAIIAGSGSSSATSKAGVYLNGGVKAVTGNISILGEGAGGGVNIGGILTANASPTQTVKVTGRTSVDTVSNYGVQFSGSSGIDAGNYLINGSSTATGHQNGSAGVYLSGSFSAQQNSSVSGSTSNAAGMSVGVALAQTLAGTSTLNLNQTAGTTLSITGVNSSNNVKTISGTYTAIDSSGVSNYGAMNIGSGAVNVAGTGGSGSASGTTVANRSVNAVTGAVTVDQGYIRSSGFINVGNINISNSGTAFSIAGTVSGTVPTLSNNTYNWTNPVTLSTASVTDKAYVAKSGVTFASGSISYGAGTLATITGTSSVSNAPSGNGAGVSNYNDGSSVTGSLNFTGVNGAQISGTSTNGTGVYFLQTGSLNINGGSVSVVANSTNSTGMYGAGVSVSNSGILSINATGKTTGFSNGGGAGISSTGNSSINLTGTATTGKGVDIQGFVRAALGSKINIIGNNTGSGDGISLLNGSIWCGVTDCGFGAIGGTTAGDISLSGSSASNGRGVILGGLIQSQSKITISGTTSSPTWYAAYLAPVAINVLSGGASNAGDAISISGNNTVASDKGAGKDIYLATGVTGKPIISNNSNGGALSIRGNNSGITIAPVSITNASSAGAVNIITGDGTPSSLGVITAQASALITQNSASGVNISSDGNGNITVPGVINNGAGDVVVSAGKLHLAGDATGGQVLTAAGNAVANLGNGKTKIYSGSAALTGKLSNLTSAFNTLYYNGTSKALNARFNANFGDVISGASSVAQVMFRENATASPSFSIALPNLTKTYGDSDPNNLNNSFQSAYTAAGGATTLSKIVGNNTFGLTASDVISTLAGTRLSGENVGTYAYNLVVGEGLNTTLSPQPNMLIGKRDITINTLIASNKVYDGTSIAKVIGAKFDNMVNGESLALTGNADFSDKNVGDN
ncbi:filamentous hemagglutinin N-terminal domain-containing protein [Hydromonas duriensis]|uniref:Filamentous hemagglutinin family protein n=1 Tax=Hydromonas duriensis TaxID=1527608 RepID=A0A4V3DJJ0_9BURK|nr:filamentous hemagglutinin N-terminal domain-containing protein [Hydromonas duriensis]TDR27886.1 filamentous hemagglutinin family protein [Hydromonas duriensis]